MTHQITDPIGDVVTAPFELAGDFIDGAADVGGDAAGSLLGGLFGGFGDWLLKLLAIGVVGYLVAGAL